MGKPRPALPYHEANKQGAADIPGAHQGGLIGWRKKSEPPPLGICGGGLAGCLAAVYLARRGERVELYEFRPDPRAKNAQAGRSINLTLTTRGLTALGKVGLREEIEKRGVRLNGRVLHNPGRKPEFVAYGPDPELHYLLSVPRPELNKALLDAAEAEENVTCFFDRKLLDADLPPMPACPTGSSDTHTTLVFRNMNVDESGNSPDPTERKVVKAVLGCDGMYSRVRAAIQRKQPRFDFSQQFIPAGYKELTIPPQPLGKGRDKWRIDPNALHLWPRGQFMMIAQPNHDGSFSCTLFMPFSSEHSPTGAFDMLNTEDDVLAFFKEHFSDAIDLLPTLLTDWFERPTSPLCTVRCAPFNYGGAALLIGDAAHAIVPFYGQGCNSAFEDVSLLDVLWEQHSTNTADIFRAFSNQRKRHVDAIGDLAIEHYHELANKVTPPLWAQAWRTFSGCVEESWLFRNVVAPNYTSLYHAVSFSHDGYDDARRKGLTSEEQLGKVSTVAAIGLMVSAALALVQWAPALSGWRGREMRLLAGRQT